MVRRLLCRHEKSLRWSRELGGEVWLPEVTAEETSDHCLATHCATKVIFLAIQRSRKGWKNTQLVGLV
jgi:hypothetical protein